MSASEARALPGGAIGLGLFLLGSASVFLSAVVLLVSAFDAARVGTWGWVIPAWGIIAIAFAVALRRPRGALVAMGSRVWLAIGVIGLLMIKFGTRVQLA